MGSRGPVPKRSDQRRRRNAAGETTSAAGAISVVVPPAAEDWHPVAAQWYASLAESGQQQFYEPSDWSTAYLIAESISRDLNPQFVGFAQVSRDQTEPEYAKIPLKGASLGAYLKAMGDLLTTEGSRRRASVELQRAQAETASVTSVVDYRARVSPGA
jgi:hypothetical protein